MEMPQSLLDAKAAAEAAMDRKELIDRSRDGAAAAGVQANDHHVSIQREIRELRDAIAGDDALAGIADEERMSKSARADAERRLSALCKEQITLAGKIEQSAAAAASLLRVSATRAQEVSQAQTAFQAEKAALYQIFLAEFRRDAASLPMPMLFKKWFAIAMALGYRGIVEQLNAVELRIGERPVLIGGKYFDPGTGGEIDLKKAWRTDATLSELHRTIAAAIALQPSASRVGKAAATVQGASGWFPTDAWKAPPSAGRPFAVERRPSAMLGLAKRLRIDREKLASELGALARVRIPEITVAAVAGSRELYAISHVRSAASRDLLTLRSEDPGRFNSPAVQCAIAEASGLAAFYAWIGEPERKDEHLILEAGADGACHVAAVDFGAAFGWGADEAALVSPGTLPPALRPRMETRPVQLTVHAIEAIRDDDIRSLVAALPGPLPAADRERIAQGLIERKPRVRDAMAVRGWLPAWVGSELV